MNQMIASANATIIPGGLNTAAPYEYRGNVIRSDRDDILTWLDEQEKKRDARSCPDPKIRT